MLVRLPVENPSPARLADSHSSLYITAEAPGLNTKSIYQTFCSTFLCTSVLLFISVQSVIILKALLRSPFLSKTP